MKLPFFGRRNVAAPPTFMPSSPLRELNEKRANLDRQAMRLSRVMSALRDGSPEKLARQPFVEAQLTDIQRTLTQQSLAHLREVIDTAAAENKAQQKRAKQDLESAQTDQAEALSKLQSRRAAEVRQAEAIQKTQEGAAAAVKVAEQALHEAVLTGDDSGAAAASQQLQKAQKAKSQAEQDLHAPRIHLAALQGVVLQLEQAAEKARADEATARQLAAEALQDAALIELDTATLASLAVAIKAAEAGCSLPLGSRLTPFCSSPAKAVFSEGSMRLLQACDTDQLRALAQALKAPTEEHPFSAYPFNEADDLILQRLDEEEAAATARRGDLNALLRGERLKEDARLEQLARNRFTVA